MTHQNTPIIDKPHVSRPSFTDDLNKRLKQIAEHWTLLTFLAGLVSALLGLGTLMAFTRAIGRTDLLPMALEAKSSIIPWIVIIIFLSLAYIAVLLVTTSFYALALRIFRSTPNLQPTIAKLSLFPMILGSAIFIAAVFHDPGWHKGYTLLLIAVVVVLLTLIISRKIEFRIALDLVASYSNPAKVNGWLTRHAILFVFMNLLYLTILFALYPITLLLKTYVGAETPEAINQLMVVTIFAVILTLAPTVVFFITKRNSLTRALHSLGTLLIVGVIIIAIAPGAASTIVYSAAAIIGIRETTASEFMLEERFGEEDFDKATWGAVKTVREHPVIQAFPLFAMADILLLCPAPLLNTKLVDWPSKSIVCVMTKNSTVTRMPVTYPPETSKQG